MCVSVCVSVSYYVAEWEGATRERSRKYLGSTNNALNPKPQALNPTLNPEHQTLNLGEKQEILGIK